MRPNPPFIPFLPPRMVVHNFAQIPAVPTAETLVEDVLRAGQKQAMDTEQLSMDEIRSFYMRKVSLAQQAFAEKMATIVESFPQMDTLHSFFADLFSVLYERDHFLLATAKLSDGGSSIARVASDYTKLLLFADSPDRCKEQARVSLGRMCTCIIQLNASLAYLEQVSTLRTVLRDRCTVCGADIGHGAARPDNICHGCRPSTQTPGTCSSAAA
eukprot:1733185-Rhodomonas_salina.2